MKHGDIRVLTYRSSHRAIHLNFNDFSLNQFRFILDPYTDRSAKGLSKRFGFGHFQWKDFRTGNSSEWDIRSKCLGNTYMFIKIYRVTWISDFSLMQIDCMYIQHIPIAMAVLPVPGWPANRMARPAIVPSLIISRITPAERRAFAWPTIPWDTWRGSSASSRPRPRMWEWAPAVGMKSYKVFQLETRCAYLCVPFWPEGLWCCCCQWRLMDHQWWWLLEQNSLIERKCTIASKKAKFRRAP